MISPSHDPADSTVPPGPITQDRSHGTVPTRRAVRLTQEMRRRIRWIAALVRVPAAVPRPDLLS
ncbi:hypothetical protein E3N86_09450 [Cryobacterium sp. Hz7]|uniref:hypothetical protein n=1 Tax=Cryobacterium sp. Hz7 TaxID=1259166 RepID=UPI00106C99A9|nr:hypothetical protein [Cryobacterium sp. Hz7]TFB60289.1 hypothetical protein E3N86_09450 [Cryobacterium sp. Hz7]